MILHCVSSIETTTEKTTWHSINVFKPYLQDVVMKLVQKGSRVYINGRLSNTKYVKDGAEKYITVIIAGQPMGSVNSQCLYLSVCLSIHPFVCLSVRQSVDDLIHLQHPRSSMDNEQGIGNNSQQENFQQENFQEEQDSSLNLNIESVPHEEAR